MTRKNPRNLLRTHTHTAELPSKNGHAAIQLSEGGKKEGGGEARRGGQFASSNSDERQCGQVKILNTYTACIKAPLKGIEIIFNNRQGYTSLVANWRRLPPLKSSFLGPYILFPRGLPGFHLQPFRREER